MTTSLYDKSVSVSNYASIGHMKTKKQAEEDQLSCCLPGGFMNCKNGDYPYTLATCPEYMSERCAKNWDDNCTIYAESLTIREDQDRFLSKVADKRYCKVEDDNSLFFANEYQQLSNPQDPDSPEFSEWKGPQVYYKETGTCSLGPTYFMPATDNRTCVKLDPKKIKGEFPIKQCLRQNTCNDVVFQSFVERDTQRKQYKNIEDSMLKKRVSKESCYGRW